MKIQFIGTGKMDSFARANTSVLLDNILFDCGMGTIKQLEKLGNRVEDLNYLVITHFHADHFFDIPNLIICRKAKKPLKKLYIVGPKGIRDKIYEMMIFTFGYSGCLEDYANLEFVELESNQIYKMSDWSLTTFEMRHGKTFPCYGYLLEKQGINFGYTGDTTICDNIYKMCEKADYMAIDTSYLKDSDTSHLGLADLEKVASKYKNCRFYAVHRGDYKIPITSKIYFPNDGDIVEI